MAELNEWIFALPEREYTFTIPRDITTGLLLHIENWYPGDDICMSMAFQMALYQGDVEAIACACWALRRRDGAADNVEPKRFVDFNIGEVFIAPNRTPDDPEPPRWTIHFEGDELEFDPATQLTAKHLRALAKHYPTYRRYTPFLYQLGMGHPIAAKAAIWIARDVAGIQPNPAPWDLDVDFSVQECVVPVPREDDVEVPPKAEVDEDRPLDIQVPTADQGASASTADPSTDGLPDSGRSGSSSSDTSVTSDPQN